MSRLYANATGEIIRYLKTEEDEGPFGIPDTFASTLEFDAETNPEIVEGLDTDWNRHALIGGILYRGGQAVTIKAPGQTYLDREYLREFWSDLGTAITFTANARDAWPGMTGAQKQAWFADNFDKVLWIIHGMLRFIRWLVKEWMKRQEL